jgi:hypothetical protein
MKITKKQLKRLIRQEKSKLLAESRKGSVSLGFEGWSPNKQVDFAKAYGKDARVLRDFGSNSNRASHIKQSPRLKESIADMDNVEAEVYGSSVDIAQTFIEEMGVLFAEDPEMFRGRSTEAEWRQQVEWAGTELEQEIADAINAAIERIEMRLHDGQFLRHA